MNSPEFEKWTDNNANICGYLRHGKLVSLFILLCHLDSNHLFWNWMPCDANIQQLPEINNRDSLNKNILIFQQVVTTMYPYSFKGNVNTSLFGHCIPVLPICRLIHDPQRCHLHPGIILSCLVIHCSLLYSYIWLFIYLNLYVQVRIWEQIPRDTGRNYQGECISLIWIPLFW